MGWISTPSPNCPISGLAGMARAFTQLEEAHTAGRRLQHPGRVLPLFSDGGLDRIGDRRDQGHPCSRAEVQFGAHFLSKDFLRRFYCLNGTVSCGLHGAPLGIIGGRPHVSLYGFPQPPVGPRQSA
jgi:hypothetical protein